MTGLSDVVTSDLVTETELEGARLAVRFVGCVDGSTLEEVRVFLAAMHGAARAASAVEVVMDLRTLEFISASGLGVLASWLGDVKRTSSYAVRFLTDARLPSQRRSLEPLAQLDRSSVCVEAV